MSQPEPLSTVLARYTASPNDADARRLADEVPGLLTALNTLVAAADDWHGAVYTAKRGDALDAARAALAKFEAEGK